MTKTSLGLLPILVGDTVQSMRSVIANKATHYYHEIEFHHYFAACRRYNRTYKLSA